MNLDYTNKINEIPWRDIKVVIFDLDGTLYHRPSFEKYAFSLIEEHLKQNPEVSEEYEIMQCFFKIIDDNAAISHESLFNYLCSIVAENLNLDIKLVGNVVNKWIINEGLITSHLKKYKLDFIDDFFNILSKNNIKRVIYSDMYIGKKLLHLNLSAELHVSSLDSNIDNLKPTSKAINYIKSSLDLNSDQCLLIGDQYELDGQSALMSKIPFVILPSEESLVSSLRSFYRNLIDSFKINNSSYSLLEDEKYA